MRALVFDRKQARVEERPIPAPGGDQALVRVRLAGVCNTDLEIVRGYMGFQGVLGHEFVGVVEEGATSWLGARVVGEINFACGRCATCATGLVRHCPSRRVMGILDADGAFAEYLAVPVANLHRVPEGLPDEAAVFVEPLAAAFEILEQVELAPGARCVVLGDGKLGLLAAQVLHAAGARVLAVGHHPEKLRILSARGIETSLEPRGDGERVGLVVEATGTAEGFGCALQWVRPRGSIVLKSTVAHAAQLDLTPLVIHEIQVVGSRCGPFPPALAALEAGAIDVASMVTERLPLARADEALRRAASPEALKLLVECS